MMDLRSAVSLYKEYRAMAENEANVYTDLMITFPGKSFPKHAARVWRYGVLAELWGTIASKLGKSGQNYLDKWRSGQ